jgi:endonuclease YncB( thermonuclease family)
MRRHSHRAPALASIIAAAIVAIGPAAAQQHCGQTSLGTATVASVRDGRTLLLSDGRELRLAGIEAADEGRAALQSLTAGATLRLRRLGPEHDRYGRLVAFAYAGAGETSLQQALLAAGEARVSARVGDKTCASVLLEAESIARTGKHGLWADPNFAPLPADNLAVLRTKRGQFALVEGKVLSVHASGGTIYVNFGRRWTRDFSVSIRRRLQKSFTAAGLEPDKLQGRRIRVRGWLEQRSGPAIDVDAPEQIEFVDRR